MAQHIAIPVSSSDSEYNGRSLPPYLEALEAAGALPEVIALDTPPARVARLLANVSGVLLPGSRFDVDPERYGERRIGACNEADPARTAVDELLLQDAFNLRKPILAICYGMQSLNVWCNGSLIQDLGAEGLTKVNHAPGRHVAEAHGIVMAPGSRLEAIAQARPPLARVNSSHHQAVRVPGDHLRVTAVSQEDQVIEAVELEDADHFVVGVQWHPERTYEASGLSRGIFAAFVRAAAAWRLPFGQ
ncbi:MAG: gamma-glutamyl-gamma-aminobutyrate hydrolase family protein [Acidobacteriota bacterium]